MIEQVYNSAKRHKHELSCTVYTPDTTLPITDSDKLGITSAMSARTVPCIKSSRSRRREQSQTGAKFVSVFSLLINTSGVNVTITYSSIIELLGKRYTIFAFDHNLEETYWKVDLRDE